MCWKYEWAYAINNITRALAHVEKAKAKLEKRATRNRATIAKVRNIPRRRDILRQAATRLAKMQIGIAECGRTIAHLKRTRIELCDMINTYGITRSENPQRTKLLLMGKCDICKTEPDTDKQPCKEAPYCTWNQ